MNRTLVESAHTMLHHANLPKTWWAEAVNTSNFIRNRIPSTRDENTTPFQMLYKSKPDLGMLKIFGCSCYVLFPKEQRRKWDEKAEPDILIGYGSNSKTYKIWNLKQRRVMHSSKVTFFEDEFQDLEEQQSDFGSAKDAFQQLADARLELETTRYELESERAAQQSSHASNTEEIELLCRAAPFDVCDEATTPPVIERSFRREGYGEGPQGHLRDFVGRLRYRFDLVRAGALAQVGTQCSPAKPVGRGCYQQPQRSSGARSGIGVADHQQH